MAELRRLDASVTVSTSVFAKTNCPTDSSGAQEGHFLPESRLGPLGSQADDDQGANDGQTGADEIGGARTLVLGDPQPEQRRGNVNAPYQHRPDLRGGIDARQVHAKAMRLTTPVLRPETMTSRRNQSQKAKHPAISRHAATTKTATFVTIRTMPRNSRVTDGPVSSTDTGPPSGSTTIRKRRNLQHGLRLHRLHDESKCAVSCRERQPMSVGELLVRVGTARQFGSSPSRRAAKASGPRVQATGRSEDMTSPTRVDHASPLHDGSTMAS